MLTLLTRKRNAKLEKSLEEDAQLHPLELKGTMDKPYLSPLEVANYFGVSKATIYRYLANGLIKSLQLRRSTLIRKADIDALFDLAPDEEVSLLERLVGIILPNCALESQLLMSALMLTD